MTCYRLFIENEKEGNESLLIVITLIQAILDFLNYEKGYIIL